MLNKYARDYCSQFGEDGIIEEIFRRLNITGGWTVEFGAMDGAQLSNTYHLIDSTPNFSGIYIEGDPRWCSELHRICYRYTERMFPVCEYITVTGEHSLQSILKRFPIPADFELLSIDVDGADYQIWSEFWEYSPKITLIEVNSSFLPNIEYINGSGDMGGTSFLSMLKLGRSKGYTLVCHTGNMIFVRNDLVDGLGMDKLLLANPSRMFNDFWIQK